MADFRNRVGSSDVIKLGFIELILNKKIFKWRKSKNINFCKQSPNIATSIKKSARRK